MTQTSIPPVTLPARIGPTGSRNPGMPLSVAMFAGHRVNRAATERRAADLAARPVSAAERATMLVDAVRYLDLTTLAGDDTDAHVARLSALARRPLSGRNMTVGAVCVYPTLVPAAVRALDGSGLPVASVATGFPTGLMPWPLRLEEIGWAVGQGAAEIDVVITRAHVLRGDWAALYDEVAAMRSACGPARMKVILATGELGSLASVHAAAMVSMQAGADFVKTSTGKEPVNATLPMGLVMARAIRDYHAATGYRVGLKPAGGLKTAGDAIAWQVLVREILGPDWLDPRLFRLGASSMLGDIDRHLAAVAT